jgi:sugar/nucleoside kinase (ribokinase family)
MSAAVQPAYVCVGGIIVDDIVFPNGETRMEILGGGLVHSAAGMSIWGQRAGLVACAGRDLPESAQRRLKRDFDLQGMIWLDLPQARAWQLFEWDGKRSEVFRVDTLRPFIYEPGPDQVPAAYRQAKGVYLLRDAAQLPAWRGLYPQATLLWEPLQQYMQPENTAEFRAALPYVDIVSPNWLEAQAIYHTGDPGRLVQAMLDDGAKIVALRMGDAGSVIGRRGIHELLRVPAVPVPTVVDQTGAGNTYCGSFLVGWLETGNLLTAGCYAAVSASFALETIGIADPPSNMQAVRDARYRQLYARLQHPVA